MGANLKKEKSKIEAEVQRRLEILLDKMQPQIENALSIANEPEKVFEATIACMRAQIYQQLIAEMREN